MLVQCDFVFFTGSDAYNFAHFLDPDLAVTNIVGSPSLDNHVGGHLNERLAVHNFELDLRNVVDSVFDTAVGINRTTL